VHGALVYAMGAIEVHIVQVALQCNVVVIHVHTAWCVVVVALSVERAWSTDWQSRRAGSQMYYQSSRT
jgi:hypothetical protein